MGKKHSSKREKAKAKKMLRDNKNQLVWDILPELAQYVLETIGSLDNIGKKLKDTYPDKLNNPTTREVFTGFYKLLKEHIDQVHNLMLCHALKDTDGNPKKNENGMLMFKKGIVTKLEDISTITNLVMEYYQEADLITNIADTIVLELVSQFEASEDILNIINNLRDKLKNESNKAMESINNVVLNMTNDKEVSDGKQE